MNQERRRFLKKLATVCAGGVARKLGVGVGAAVATGTVATVATAATASAAVAAGQVGSGVRQQVFEVIVRQAMAGAPWEAICQGPMQVNGITVEEVQREVARRSSVKHSREPGCLCARCLAARVERSKRYEEVIADIPHSDKSPCACKSCREAVSAILLARTRLFLREGRELES